MNSNPVSVTRRVRRRRTLVAALVLVAVAATGITVQQSLSAASFAFTSNDVPAEEVAAGAPESSAGMPEGPVGEADGAIPDGGQPSVFDTERPAVGNLDPALLDALQRAAEDADRDGIGIRVNSGWRSARYQQQLLQDALAEYGSAEEAARWVATPETSAHVSGDAVDLGPFPALDWLAQHGSDYGLCQIYGNEPWHYELRPEAVDEGCPEMYADPTHDPRMRR